MSLGWKVTAWTILVLSILGVLNALPGFDFVVIFFGIAVIAICIKCLELGKDVEIKNSKIKKLESGE